MKLLLFSFLLLVAPCNSSKQIAQQTATDNSKVMIVYQTTVCFGRCPVLTLAINGETKMATFIGTANTEKIGTYTKPITSKELEDTYDKYYKYININAFKFNENYYKKYFKK